MSTRPMNLTRINREPPTGMRQPKWSIALVLSWAVFATSFAAGQVALDGSSSLNAATAAIRGEVAVFVSPARSTAHAFAFQQVDRAAKGDRLRVFVARREIDVNRGSKRDISGAARSRRTGESEGKPLMHCELVGSPLASPAVYMPPRICLA